MEGGESLCADVSLGSDVAGKKDATARVKAAERRALATAMRASKVAASIGQVYTPPAGKALCCWCWVHVAFCRFAVDIEQFSSWVQ